MPETKETPTAPAAEPAKKKGKTEAARNGISEWAVTILLLLFATTTLVQAFVIPTGSMMDNLLIGDHLLVDKLAYAPAGAVTKYLLPYENPKHGDIIVFRFPGDISQTFVKRVIGVPGDHIKTVNRVVYRNGKPLYEPYVFYKQSYAQPPDDFPGQLLQSQYPLAIDLEQDMLNNHVQDGEVVVPPNSYFAMGDNRQNSLDSRYWGFVPRDNIIGKPLIIYWSYKASTEDLAGSSVSSLISHGIDLLEHFFTRTRWSRTARLIRGFPDSKLPDHPLPPNAGSPDP